MPEHQRVVFELGQEEEAAEEEAARRQANQEQENMLTAYFQLNNQLGAAEAQLYTYATINRDYFYDKPAKKWRRRTNERHNHIYRLGTVGATNIEAQVQTF